MARTHRTGPAAKRAPAPGDAGSAFHVKRPVMPAQPEALRGQLADGLAAMGVALEPEAQARVLAHLALVARWNRVYNLTAIRDPRQMLVQHALDSLAALPAFDSAAAQAGALHDARGTPPGSPVTVLDVGTGAGFPGLPLAIARPHWRLTLVDTVEKKAAFLRQAVGELGLANVEVLNTRIETLARPAFDLVTCRAYSSLAKLCDDVDAVADTHTRLLALKGERPDDEMAALPAGWRVDAVDPLSVPGLDAERHLIHIARHA